MRAQAGALLQAGLALKYNQIKQALHSYVRDRSTQGQGAVMSYAVGGGLYAAAGVFLIAACLVGVTALFRWIEITYGMFWAFAASGGTLLILTMLCAVIASRRLHRPAKQFPSLVSRLRVAISANPLHVDGIRDAAASMMVAPVVSKQARSAKKAASAKFSRGRAVLPTGRGAQVGLLLATSLAGWAMARRYQTGRSERMDS